MNPILPLSKFAKFSSSSVDEAQRHVANIFCPHQFTLLNRSNTFSTQVNEAPFGKSALVYISYGTAVKIETEQLSNSFLVQVPWKGSARVEVAGSNTIIRPGLASIISPNQEMKMLWSQDCAFFSVRLDKKKIEEALVNILGCALPIPLVFETTFDLNSPEGTSWLNAVHFISQQLELSLQPLATFVLLQQLEHTLCLMLLNLTRHNYNTRLLQEIVSLAPKTIHRAKDFIRQNIQQHITLKQLAQITDVAPATLTKHFSHFVGLSPMKYVRNEKLSEVRQILLSNQKNITVTDVALMFGFNHLGRFAEYYKNRFGELPSETYQRHG